MSSDSSDDEDMAKLREAADSQFINDSMFSKKSAKEQQPQVERPQSLRYSKDEDEQFNLFHVSPDFRKHVANHLSTMLDKLLEIQLVSKGADRDDNYAKPKRQKNGIKLFHNSPHHIKLKAKELDIVMPVPKKTVNRKRGADPVSEDQLRLVAVSPEDILSKKDTKSWSTRSKAPVYAYVKSKDGLVMK